MAKLDRSIDAAKFSALDAGLKAAYTQQGDKYVLDVDDSPALAALESERQAKKALETRLAGYGDLTPEQVKQLTDAKAKAERDKDFSEGKFEKTFAEQEAKHAKVIESHLATQKQLAASLESALIGEEAVRALAEHGGNADLLMPIIRSRAKLETVGERTVAVVIGEKGAPLLKAGAQKADDYMPISEFVGTVLKPDKRYAGAFASPAGSGTGGNRNGLTRPSSQSTSRQATVSRIQKAIIDGATTLSE